MVPTKQSKSTKLQVPVKTHFWTDTTSIYTNTICALLLIIGYFAFYNKAEMMFYTAPDKLPITFFTDKADNGSSIINKTWQNDTSVGIECTLRKGFLFP